MMFIQSTLLCDIKSLCELVTVSILYISSLNFQAHDIINPLNTELNPICHLLALLGTHHILHISRIRVK
jgi:hypothetical protein